MSFLDRLSAAARESTELARERARLAAHGPSGPSLGSILLAGGAGALLGAALAALLDPARGRARRARLTDQSAATLRRVARHGGRLARRIRAEADGRLALARATRTPEARPTDDATLTDRVHSILFRDDSVPKGTINVNVERGIVVLRGEVPDESLRSRLVSEVEGIDGVWSVRDLLHLPGEPATAATGRTG